MIGIIPDLHLKNNLNYSDLINDSRESEKENVLNFIIESFSDCDKVVLLGDNLNSRTNSSKTIKDFVNFLERFGNKEIFIICGNHDKQVDGTSAEDFIKEIKNKNWHVINKVETFGEYTFLAHMFKAELKASSNEEAIETIMNLLPKKGKVLFHHHMVSDTFLNNGLSTNDMPEPVLPKEELEKRFDLNISGHVHSPGTYGKTILAGSIFCNEVGETEKYIWKLDEDTLKISSYKIPQRGIIKIENPTDKDLEKIENGNIIKVILTEKLSAEEINKLEEKLKRFDAHIIVEHTKTIREKIDIKDNKSILELSIEELLDVYAKQKEVPIDKLIQAFNLIK